MTAAADRAQLDAFQAAVLTTLHEGGAGEVVRQQLAVVAPDPELRAWVEGWDPDLVDLASLLVRTWAVRDAPG